MNLTFVHIGDLHKQPGPRGADVLRALDSIIDECIGLKTVAAWLIPGDLFHQRSTPEDRNALADRLLGMTNVAPVILCDGNHDAPGDLAIFGRLKGAWPVYVVSTPYVLDVALPFGQIASLFVLPYPTKGGLVAAGVAPDDVVDTAADPLEAIFTQAAAQLREAEQRGHLTLMIGHVNVGGAITSSGQPNIGREIEISARHLDLLGDVYKGLNHIHVAQDIAGASYAGSVCRLNWGEVEAKSYTVVHYEQGVSFEHKGHGAPRWDYTVARRPIDVAPMYHVEGVLTRESFTWHVVGDLITLGTDEATGITVDWTGADVRVRYAFAASERGLVDVERVRREFEGARTLLLEPVAVPDRQLRAPEIVAATTPAAKFEAYCHASGITLTTSLAVKRQLLEQLDAAAAIAGVQVAIAKVEAEAEKAEVAA